MTFREQSSKGGENGSDWNGFVDCAVRIVFVATIALTLSCGKPETVRTKTLQPEAITRLFPAGPPPASVLDVVDLHDADLDTRLAAITLQGLVNRGERAKVFLVLFGEGTHGSRLWLEELQRKSYIEDTRKISESAYFETYLSHVNGLVVYDPALPATINIATMLGGVESRMVIAPGQLERFSPRMADVVDLRGRWNSNADAYEWAFKELWPKLRHDVLASFHPTHTRHHLRDYLISQRIFIFWVTGKGNDAPPHSDHNKEMRVAESVLAAAPPNIPVVGWWDAAELDRGMTEYRGVTWAGRHGKFTVACNWQENLSLLSGVPVDMAAVTQRFREREVARRDLKLDPNKIYISFVYMESGDSPAYWQHVQRAVWDDPARGTIPIGWSISPTVLDLAPPVAEWYLDNARPQDHFFCAISGWGYCHPYRDFMVRTPNPAVAWNEYLRTTANHMERLGLEHLALYTDAWRPYRRSERDSITRRIVEGLPSVHGLIVGMGRDDEITTTSPHYRIGNAVVSHVFTRWDSKNVGRNDKNNKWLADEIRRNTPADRPAFMFVHPLSWSYYPSDLVAITSDLGGDFLAVAPGELFSLIAESTGTAQ